MTLVRKASLALLAALAIGVSADLAAGQTRVRRVETQVTTTTVPALEIDQLEPRDFFRYEHRAILRIWQDYQLKSEDAVRGVVVIFGNATIEGRVEGDVVVVFGHLRLAKSAVVSSSVAVTAGDVVIDEGASIRGDLVVVGGGVTAAPDFSPGGEHVIVGTSWLGDRLRAIVPWFTQGLLWGRVIVPGIGWVWTVLGIVLLISLLINQVMHAPVSACADTLAAKPFSTFLVGLLVMLLAGPLSVLLAATVVGIIVVPFLWCALLIGWMVGKVGVNRWLGRVVTGQGAPESRIEGLRSFLVGFVLIALLYMVPILGLMTWALVGVFGLGAATQAFMAAIRRERPVQKQNARAASAVGPAVVNAAAAVRLRAAVGSFDAALARRAGDGVHRGRSARGREGRDHGVNARVARGGRARLADGHRGRRARADAARDLSRSSRRDRPRSSARAARQKPSRLPRGRDIFLFAVRLLHGVSRLEGHDDRRDCLQSARDPDRRTAAAFRGLARARAVGHLFVHRVRAGIPVDSARSRAAGLARSHRRHIRRPRSPDVAAAVSQGRRNGTFELTNSTCSCPCVESTDLIAAIASAVAVGPR